MLLQREARKFMKAWSKPKRVLPGPGHIGGGMGQTKSAVRLAREEPKGKSVARLSRRMEMMMRRKR